jgi:hypothetical protein
MIRIFVLTASTALLLSASTIRGQDKPDSEARAKVIAPLIDDQTLAVAHVDLTRISVDAIFDEAASLQLVPADEAAAGKMLAGMFHKRLVDAGVKDLYALFTLSEGFHEARPFFAIPLAAGSDENAIRAILPIAVAERQGDVLVLAANHNTLARLAAMKPDPRPELSAALEAAGNAAVQILYLPPKHYRRVLDETVSELPKELGGGPVQVFTRGILWATIGIDVAPKPALRIVMQSEDAQAATALRDKFAELLRLAGSNNAIKKDFPDFDAIAALLTPRAEGDRLVVNFDQNDQKAAELVAALVHPIRAVRRRAAVDESINNLRQIVLGLLLYEDNSVATGTPAGKKSAHFPLPAIMSKDGKPLLSWRVAILPYLQQKPLYDQFHLDEPWDGPHNRPLVDKMPAIYRSPLSKNKEPGRTNYLLPVGNGAGFSADQPTSMRDISDGTSNTIMIVEADDDRAVIWTKPDDWQFDPNKPAQGLGHLNNGEFLTAFFDDHGQAISVSIDPKTLKALFTRAGGEVVDTNSLR